LESFPSARQVRQIKRDALPPLVKGLTLNPGQVLYIPRGAYHEALTSDSFSLHLTIGVFPDTWADLASRLIEKQATFREALPAASSGQQLKDDLTRRINELATTLQIDAATVELE
jgi:ribosomal protein L16 Arg81 hydroxylase